MNGKKYSLHTASMLFSVCTSLLLTVLFFAGCGENQPVGVASLGTYTVTYDANGALGIPPEKQVVIENVTFILASGGGLAHDGYKFAGWNTASDGTGTIYAEGANCTVESEQILYAMWIPVQAFTVTYSSNGATAGNPPEPQSIIENTPFIIASNSGLLTKENYVFGGWNTDSLGTGISYAEGETDTSISANTTLYAMWNSQYTVTYSPNGATSGTVPAAQIKVHGTPLILAANDNALEKLGYNFAGWNTDSLGAGSAYAEGAADTANVNLMLYAQWTKMPVYSVTYSANGGTGTVPATQTKVEGRALILANGDVLTKAGYAFDGWNTDSLGAGKAYDAESKYTANASVILYAKWTLVPAYTVTYHANGAVGTIPAAQTKIEGKPLILASAHTLTKAGYSFDGWNTDSLGKGKTYDAETKYTANANAKLYAMWVQAYFVTITYNDNGGIGTVPPPQTKASNELLVLPVIEGSSVKDGYVFAGWKKDPDRDHIDYSVYNYYTFYNEESEGRESRDYTYSYSGNKDITLYAHWIEAYTVTYNANGATSGNVQVPQKTNVYCSGIILDTNSGALVKTGFGFAGWNTRADGTGSDHRAGRQCRFDENVTLYAQWKVAYTVTYDANGATSGTAPANQTKFEGVDSYLALSSGLAKMGYIFVGWNTNADGTGTSYSAGSKYTKDESVTLYAHWRLPYTITYDGNGATSGDAPATHTLDVNNSSIYLNFSNTLVKTGYAIASWNTKADGTGTSYSAGSKYTKDESVILYAQWEVAYTVTYDANGATSGTAPANDTKFEGIDLRLASNESYYESRLAKTGYIFAGWNTSADGTGTSYSASSYYTKDESVTLYAHWKVAYIVTYNANGASRGSAPSSQTKTEGVDLWLASNESYYESSLAKTGYIFAGWNTSADGTGTSYSADSKYTKDESVTLYAHWKATYTVTYNVNGATSGSTPYSQTKTEGVDLSLANGSLAKTDSIFANWNTSADGTGTSYSAYSKYTKDESVILYAQWKKASTVTYDGNGATGGDAPPTQTRGLNSSYIRLDFSNTLVKEGHVIANWNTKQDGTGTSYYNGYDYSADADVTLYAQWKVAYTVTYNANNATSGTAPENQTKFEDVELQLAYPGNYGLTKTGYIFAGWNTKADGTGINYGWSGDGFSSSIAVYHGNSDVTLYAEWKRAYTVTYNINGATSGRTPSPGTKIEGVDLYIGGSGGLTKTGYVFAGWNTMADGTGTNYYNNIYIYSKDADLTLYAKWVVEE